jgi:pyruvate dehydrogenase E2 component (dihydrolipoamide acetyltransferase)
MPKAVAINEEAAVRKMMTLTLVFDHRIVDGASAAKFLQRIKHLLEAN